MSSCLFIYFLDKLSSFEIVHRNELLIENNIGVSHMNLTLGHVFQMFYCG